MIRSLRNRYRRLFLMSGVILSLMLSGITAGAVAGGMDGLSAYQVYAKDDDTDNDEAADEIAFYGASSSGAEAYEIMVDDQKKGEGNENSLDIGNNVGRAAAVMGYLDQDRNNPIGWFTTQIAMSQRSAGYGQVAPGGAAQTMQGYMLYGRLWNMYGIDETGSEREFDLLRMIGGGALWLFYQLSNIVSFLFENILSFIQFMNPFRFLYGSGASGSALLDATMDEVGMQKGITDYFGSLGETLSDIYVALNNIGIFVTVPLLLLSIALFVTLYQGADRNNRIKGAVIKILVVFLGVPLVGMFYTSSINLMSDMIEGDNIGASYVITNTLVDFENWAKDTNLAYPSEIKTNMIVSDSATGSGYANSSTSPRKAAQLINQKAGTGSIYGSRDINSESDFNQNLYSEVSKSDKSINSQMVDLIDRYRSGSFYHASDYEADVKSSISTKEETELLSELQDPETWPEEIATNKFTNDGGLAVSYNRTDMKANPNYQVTYIQDGNLGLSTLGMYNYLCTSFDDTSAVIYSPEKTVSGTVAKYHRSVSLIGNGWSEGLYLLNALVMLMFIAVIGCVYGLGMLVGIFRRTIRMFISIMGSAFGMMSQMAQLISTVLMAVFEIVGTIFMYTIVVELMVGASTMLTDLLSGNGFATIFAASGLHVQAASIGSFGDTMVALFNTLFVGWMTFQAIKLRKQMIHSADSMMARSIERVFGYGNGSGGGRAGSPVQNNNSRSSSLMNGGLALMSAAGGAGGLARGIHSITTGEFGGGAGNGGGTAAGAEAAPGGGGDLMDSVGVNGARNAGGPPGLPEEAATRPGLGGNGVMGIEAQGNGGGEAYSHELGVDGQAGSETLAYGSLAEASMVSDTGSGIDNGGAMPALPVSGQDSLQAGSEAGAQSASTSKTEQLKKDFSDTIRTGASDKARDVAADGLAKVHPTAGAVAKAGISAQRSLASGQSMTSAAKSGAVSGISSAVSSKTGTSGAGNLPKTGAPTPSSAPKMGAGAAAGTAGSIRSAGSASVKAPSVSGPGKTITQNTTNTRTGVSAYQKNQTAARSLSTANSYQAGSSFRSSNTTNAQRQVYSTNRPASGRTVPMPQTSRTVSASERTPIRQVNAGRVINNRNVMPSQPAPVQRNRPAQPTPNAGQKTRPLTADQARQDGKYKG